jgi:prolyl-tRNA synthetase
MLKCWVNDKAVSPTYKKPHNFPSILWIEFHVLFDYRKVRASFMFSDMELIGIPLRIVIGDQRLDSGSTEYKARIDKEIQDIPLDEVVNFIQSKVKVS